MLNKTKPFNVVVAKAVEETFNQIFQKEGTSIINEFLKNNAKLELTQIADNPDLFSQNLNKLTSSASPIVEKAIVKNLYLKLGKKFETKNGYSFSEHITELKKTLKV